MKFSLIYRFIAYILLFITLVFFKFYSNKNFNYMYEIKFLENMTDIESYLYYDVLKLHNYNYPFQNDISIQNSIDLGIFKLKSDSFFCYKRRDECKNSLASIFTNHLIDHHKIFHNKFKSLIDAIDHSFKNRIIENKRLCNFLKSADASRELIQKSCTNKFKKTEMEKLYKNLYINYLQNKSQLWVIDLSEISKKPIEKEIFIRELIIIIIIFLLSFSTIELFYKKNEE